MRAARRNSGSRRRRFATAMPWSRCSVGDRARRAWRIARRSSGGVVGEGGERGYPPPAPSPAAVGLANGSFSATLNGFDIHYEVHGQGPVLMVVSHSSPADRPPASPGWAPAQWQGCHCPG